jgi:hypothetical protein
MTALHCALSVTSVHAAGSDALALLDVIRKYFSKAYNRNDNLPCALKVLAGKGGVEGGACNAVAQTVCKSPSSKYDGFFIDITSSSTSLVTCDPSAAFPPTKSPTKSPTKAQRKVQLRGQ